MLLPGEPRRTGRTGRPEKKEWCYWPGRAGMIGSAVGGEDGTAESREHAARRAVARAGAHKKRLCKSEVLGTAPSRMTLRKLRASERSARSGICAGFT